MKFIFDDLKAVNTCFFPNRNFLADANLILIWGLVVHKEHDLLFIDDEVVRLQLNGLRVGKFGLHFVINAQNNNAVITLDHDFTVF